MRLVGLRRPPPITPMSLSPIERKLFGRSRHCSRSWRRWTRTDVLQLLERDHLRTDNGLAKYCRRGQYARLEWRASVPIPEIKLFRSRAAIVRPGITWSSENVDFNRGAVLDYIGLYGFGSNGIGSFLAKIGTNSPGLAMRAIKMG